MGYGKGKIIKSSSGGGGGLTSVVNTQFTPTLSAETTPPSIGNGTLTGFKRNFDNVLDLIIYMKFGSTSTAGSGVWYFELPDSLVMSTDPGDSGERIAVGTIYSLDSGATLRGGLCVIDMDNPGQLRMMNPVTAGNFWSNTGPHSWTTNDTLGLTARIPVTT